MFLHDDVNTPSLLMEIQNISRLRQLNLGCVFVFAMDNSIVLVECDKLGWCSRVTDANTEKMMR